MPCVCKKDVIRIKRLFFIFTIFDLALCSSSPPSTPSAQTVTKSAKCDQNAAVKELIFKTDEMERVVQICLGCIGAQEEICLGTNNVSSVTGIRRLCCGHNEAVNKIISKNKIDINNDDNTNNTVNIDINIDHIDNTTIDNNLSDFALMCKSSDFLEDGGVKSNNSTEDDGGVKSNNSTEDDNKCKRSLSVKGDWWTNVKCKDGTFLKGLKLNPTLTLPFEKFTPGDFQQIEFWHFVTPICTKGRIKSEAPKVAQSSVPVLGAIGVTFFVVVCFMLCRNFKIKSVMGTKSTSKNVMRDGEEMVDHGLDGESQELGDDKAEEMVEDGLEAIQLT